MDKVVIIGGAGFMGSHTADVLTERGYQVVVFDCKPSLWLNDNQEIIVGDMLDQATVKDLVSDARFVYHFAGIADIDFAKKNPYETINLNVMGTAAAVQAAAESDVERFIYASTMYVYSPHGSFYRASKQASEVIIEAYHKQYGLDYNFLRYGSLYGPRAQKWNGIKRYVQQIISDKRLDYSGTGNERREYIHVRDAARLSVDILDEQHKNQAITVTGQQVLSSSELIDMIFEIAGINKDLVYSKDSLSSEHYEMTPYRYSPKHAKKLVPDEFIDIGQGILEVVEEIYEKKGQDI